MVHAVDMTMGERMSREMTGYDVRKDAISYDEFLTSPYVDEMKRRFDYYNGNQFIFDNQVIADRPVGTPISPASWNSAFSGYGWDDIRAMLPDVMQEQCVHPVGIPFTTIVIDNKQVVYTVPPENRIFYKDEKIDEKASKLLNRVYGGARHDHLADQLCKWTGLFDTAFQFVGWDVRNRRIIKRNLKPYEVFVIPASEDPTDLQHPDCFVAIAQLSQGFTDKDEIQDELVWQCWYQDRFWYETTPRKEYQDPELTRPGTMPNPYRDQDGNPVKPIIVTHSAEVTEMYYEGTDLLVLQNQRLDRDLTAISHTMEYQGFATMIFENMDPAELRGVSASAGAAIALPMGSDAKYIHPVIQIGEFFSAIVDKARAFARMHGIDPELVDPKVTAASGVSKAHGRRALAERREEQFPKWRPYERESYWVTSTVWNYHAPSKKLPAIPRHESALDDTVYHVEVIFGELDPVVDPLADAQKIQTDLKMNLVTRAQVLQARCRISKKAAEDLAKQIKDTNKADGLIPDLEAQPDRIGQPGNRPTNMKRDKDRTGGNVTGSSGNTSIKRAPAPDKSLGTT